jgi:hypothetical protein
LTAETEQEEHSHFQQIIAAPFQTPSYFLGNNICPPEIHCPKYSSMGERIGVYRVLVGIPEEKRPLGRPSRRWDDNIKIDLQEVGCEGMDWIDLAQDWDRCGGHTFAYGYDSWFSIKCGEFLD